MLQSLPAIRPAIRFGAHRPTYWLDVKEPAAVVVLNDLFETPIAKAVLKNTSDDLIVAIKPGRYLKEGIKWHKEVWDNPDNAEPCYSLSIRGADDLGKELNNAFIFPLSLLTKAKEYMDKMRTGFYSGDCSDASAWRRVREQFALTMNDLADIDAKRKGQTVFPVI